MGFDSLLNRLARHFADTLAEVAGRPVAPAQAMLRPAGDPKFGDYQCNAAMTLAKELRAKPRDVAERIVTTVAPALAAAGITVAFEIAGPGFINLRLADEFLARLLSTVPPAPAAPLETFTGRAYDPGSASFDRVGIDPVTHPRRIVVEYSQPNIAKQMHVGHLRSTIIGDVFARVLWFQGHAVIRQNHIGDWGTQFGILIRWYREHPLPTPASDHDVLAAIEGDYRAAQARFTEDATFADEARRAVTALQSGDPQARELWEMICKVSLDAVGALYAQLGVLLRADDPQEVRGESFYNDRLAPLIAELRRTLPAPTVEPHSRGAPWAEVRDDQGAVCVFLYDAAGTPQFKNPDGEILPLIIQKSDGAYLYATTDLAAVRYRIQELQFPGGVGAERIIYVTDARQKLHFDMWRATAHAAGWITPEVSVEHVTFGTVLGPDRKPLKTRAGGNVKLRELLDEAVARALRLLDERAAAGDESAALPTDERQLVAHRIGIGAVKYADLSRDRNGDYVFNWDTMLALQGNTAPYMLYAYARIRSIYRRALAEAGNVDPYAPGTTLMLADVAERALALHLARLPDAIETVASDLLPHTLCGYLYDLAGHFMRFYESCPVLQAEAPLRASRLRLCDLTARALRLGLGLLGIPVVERM